MADSGAQKRRNSNNVTKSDATSNDTTTRPAKASNSSTVAKAYVNPNARPGSGHWGFTEDGTRFDVPDTLNTMEIFLPWNLSIGSVISGTCVLTALYLTLFGDYSKWLHIGIFFFWRLSYDVGLGVILREQSEHKRFQQFYLRHYGDGTSWKARLFDHLAIKQLPADVRAQTPITSYPQVFRAWLVYKNLVNIILVNDGLSYLMLGVKCFHFPTEWTALVIFQYFAGICLALFNWWAKVDAHRCIGEYCWYWGDFFFRKDLNLTFDGIFELFPHPMYTVGYSLYYGYSLIARSYTMLFVSLVAHGLQLAFLFFVEEPHIKRTYGAPPAIDKSKIAVLYDPKSGWFPAQKDAVFLSNFDVFRSGDFSVLLFAVYGVALAYLPSNPVWALAQCVLWRCIHWIGLGTILWGQSTFQLWTRHFTTRGRTIYEAFGHWKTTYNLSQTMNIIVFIACALRYAEFSWSYFASAETMACCAVGLVLIALSVWSYTSTYEAVGEFGWFYGDFFIAQESFKQNLCYTGIFRFINNPDCVTGYAGQYGLALIAQSWPIFFLALGSHVLNILFLNLVEIPHMEKLYSQKELRSDADAPFPKALARIQKTVLPSGLKLDLEQVLPPTMREVEKNLRSEVRHIKNKAMEEMYQIYKKLADTRTTMLTANTPRSSSASPASSPGGMTQPAARRATSAPSRNADQVVTLACPERVTLGEAMTVRFHAPPLPNDAKDDSARPRAAKVIQSKSSYDWIGVFPVDVASGPGASDGKWLYVEGGDDNVVFPPTLLPSSEGVYEVRYHRNNSYKPVAAHPFILAEPHPSPTSSPPPPAESESKDL